MAVDPLSYNEFPDGHNFLSTLEAVACQASKETGEYLPESGKKLPATVESLGDVLSILYRCACCAFGCREGDHQIEWLTGRVVNQSSSAYRLILSAYYDESLMLIRGVGEIANLLWLFGHEQSELNAWMSASRRVRLNDYSPRAVREKLAQHVAIGPPIDRDRYAKLCEVGTHPIPKFAPGHYSGTGRPVLGLVLQPVGLFVSMTELGFAVAMCAIPLGSV